ncbi:reverse transcriptase-like protein [Apostichopus japonicus]|uniref:Reverse transcriptase-like protein n=1 Tax=Stichopus japonicus TaxID=307972 RepID=A0A2G8L8K7_STIJA|nr:reverse transcriptase-like protein [Apostichopus japonicus]
MLDGGGIVILVLLDLSAAFDIVDLLCRMRGRLGINGTALNWFRSYLTNRSQSVNIHGTRSSSCVLKYGVPQGSVLGPLLFLTYVLPLGELIDSHSIHRHSFADDTQLYTVIREIKDPAQVHQECLKLECCLNEIQHWLTDNFLKGNPSKTEIMLFGTPQRLKQVNIVSITVAGVDVKISGAPVRNLGVLIDPQLSMKPYVYSVVKSGYFHLRNIALARRQLSKMRHDRSRRHL